SRRRSCLRGGRDIAFRPCARLRTLAFLFLVEFRFPTRAYALQRHSCARESEAPMAGGGECQPFLPASAARGEGDHPTQIGWWKGRRRLRPLPHHHAPHGPPPHRVAMGRDWEPLWF